MNIELTNELFYSPQFQERIKKFYDYALTEYGIEKDRITIMLSVNMICPSVSGTVGNTINEEFSRIMS